MAYDFERVSKGSEEFPIGIFSQSAYLEESHYHVEYEFFYLSKGTVEFYIENSKAVIHEGDIIFLSPGTSHYIKKIEDSDYEYYAMIFDNSVFGNESDPIRKMFDGIQISRFLNLPEPLIQKLKEITEYAQNKLYGYQLMVKTILYDIISYVIKTNQFVEITNNMQFEQNHSVNAIDVTLNYIREHYRENISLDDILEITTYSKSHFIRLFKKSTGMNLTDFINKYRIEKSCLDLIYTNKNITEIATENGFNTVQYFSKTFKNYMNCTPKQYQRNGKNIIIPSSTGNITISSE